MAKSTSTTVSPAYAAKLAQLRGETDVEATPVTVVEAVAPVAPVATATPTANGNGVALPEGFSSMAEFMAAYEALRAETAKLRKTTKAGGLSLKVSEKGAVSVYGLGRFPQTLYKEQWMRLLDIADDIRAFITQNDAQLKTKPVNS